MVKPHEQVEFSFPTENVCSQDHLMLHSVVLFSMVLCFRRIALSFLNVKQCALWRNCGQANYIARDSEEGRMWHETKQDFILLFILWKACHWF
jgi:hypothetical protein